jgi:glutaredoxin
MNTPKLLRTLRPLALLPLLLPASPAWALYKVVQADGSVTYTDRAPIDANARIVPLGRNAPAAEAQASPTTVASSALPPLPAELRQAMQRHPVVLYSAAECAPCNEGRTLLQQRGVPYSEKRVASDDDVAALERLTGGRTVPSLALGAQSLRGFSTDWNAFLDAAGYPRESRLPRGWPTPVATPLVERVAATAPVAPQPLPPTTAPNPVPPPPGIRF